MFDTIKKVAVVALFSFAASGAQAALVTFNTSGVLATGYDGLNVFGLGIDLAGKSFTQTTTIDLDGLPILQGSGFDLREGMSRSLATTVSVDGVSYSWKSSFGRGLLNMVNMLTLGQPDGYDSAWMIAAADLSATSRVNNSTGIWSSQTPILQDANPLMSHQFNMQLPGVLGESYFQMWRFGANAENTLYKGIVTSATLTYDPTVSPVPEPGTVAMFMLGVGLVGVAARKRKAATAV